MSFRAVSWLLLVGGINALKLASQIDVHLGPNNMSDDLASEGPARKLDTPVCGMAYHGATWSLSCDSADARRLAKTIPPVPWKQTNDCKMGPPKGYKWYSQGHEDLDLYNNYFCNTKGGTFAEIGALNGIRWSNTKFFEDSMGWSGLLIEAAPSSASHLKENRNNEANLIIAEGVCPQEQGNMSFLVGPNADVNGNPDDKSDKNLQHVHHLNGYATITVPCRPLSAMLRDFLNRSRATHIDFFSLDVEGGELAVLSTFDFGVPVHVWIVEMDGTNPSKDESVRQLLMKHGYTKSKKEFAGKNNEVWAMSQFV